MRNVGFRIQMFNSGRSATHAIRDFHSHAEESLPCAFVPFCSIAAAPEATSISPHGSLIELRQRLSFYPVFGSLHEVA
jgi:hypothetical protein